MLFKDMTWMDVEGYLEKDDRVVVIAGACEQHGYLSLLSDALIPQEIAQEACRSEGVLIAPSINYGISTSFTAYPGTLTLKPETYALILRDILQGLLTQGFRRILVSNGHGGNTGIITPILLELGNEYENCRLDLFQYWQTPLVQSVIRESGLAGYHANWTENFTFTRLGPVPEGQKTPVLLSSTLPAKALRQGLGDGNYGDAYQADDETIEKFFKAAVEANITALQNLKSYQL